MFNPNFGLLARVFGLGSSVVIQVYGIGAERHNAGSKAQKNKRAILGVRYLANRERLHLFELEREKFE